MKKFVLLFCLACFSSFICAKSQTIIVDKQEVYDFLDENEFHRYNSYEVSETEKNSIEKQKKQPEKQVETAVDEPKSEEKKGFFKRLFGA